MPPRAARAQALASESQNELSTDPEVSVLLAREAVEVSPIPQAVTALREAIEASDRGHAYAGPLERPHTHDGQGLQCPRGA